MHKPNTGWTGAVGPTRDTLVVRRAGVSVPVRSVARIETDEFGLDIVFLSCGHNPGSKVRKDGRYACYTCQVELAKSKLGAK